MLKISIKQLNLRYLKLAVDITEEPYYGKLDNPYIWSRTPKFPNRATGCFKYLTISATNYNYKLILFNMMLSPCYDVEDIIPQALNEIKNLISFKQVTFDRGFQKKALIHKLETMKINYLIFCTRNKTTIKILNSMENNQIKTLIRKFSYPKNQTTHKFESKYIFIKNYHFKQNEESYDWIFADYMSFCSIRHTIGSYRNHWGIETTFRVLKQDFRIKTTSKYQSVRLVLVFFNVVLQYLASCKIFY